MPLYNQPSISNGAAPPSIEIIIDVGQIPIYTKTINISNHIITPLSNINVWQSGVVFGYSLDEREMDALLLSGTPKSGSFDLTISVLPGPIVGLFKIRYTVT